MTEYFFSKKIKFHNFKITFFNENKIEKKFKDQVYLITQNHLHKTKYSHLSFNKSSSSIKLQKYPNICGTVYTQLLSIDILQPLIWEIVSQKKIATINKKESHSIHQKRVN